MPKILKATRFGNPILRTITQQLTVEDILSDKIQTLIDDMRYTLVQKSYGVGLAAPQVNVGVALSVIGIKPTPNRPDLIPFDTVLINPKVIQTYGKRKQMWEGCISCGVKNDTLFGKVPRFESIKLSWLDERGKRRQEILDGFVAHVAQHETDHLNGILFVDHVKDTTSYMMADEYRKRIIQQKV
jgi:peptide deformylase